MKVAVFFVALVAVASAYHVDFPSEDEVVNTVNSDPSSTWVAGKSERFADMSLNDIMGMFGTVIEEAPEIIGGDMFANYTDIPDSFDARTKWPKCIHAVENQEKCGSCWAFSASEALADRFCIQGHDVGQLSPQTLVSCDGGDMGCSGGRLGSAWSFMESHGVATMTCEPYTSGSGTSGSCPRQCADGSSPKYYKATGAHSVVSFFDSKSRKVEKIQKEIMTNGPVQVAFTVYSDFMSYKSGVYQHKTGSMLGGHAVEAVGWGVDNGTPYWIIRNSWGPTWGLSGYFKIIRGQNECGIEGQVWAGEPAL